MFKPKITKLDATSSEQIFDAGINVDTMIIKNEGSTDCYIDFDETITTDTSYLIESGEVVTLEGLVMRRLHYKTVAGTTTLRVIRLVR